MNILRSDNEQWLEEAIHDFNRVPDQEEKLDLTKLFEKGKIEREIEITTPVLVEFTDYVLGHPEFCGHLWIERTITVFVSKKAAQQALDLFYKFEGSSIDESCIKEVAIEGIKFFEIREPDEELLQSFWGFIEKDGGLKCKTAELTVKDKTIKKTTTIFEEVG